MSSNALSELYLSATNIRNSKVSFTFILRNPKQLTAYDVQSCDLNFQGHKWYVICKRNSSHFAAYLGWQVHSVHTQCNLNFTFAIVNRKKQELAYLSEKDEVFTHREKVHGFDKFAKLNTLLDGREGFRSTLSDWFEIELTVWNCSTRTSIEVPCLFSGSAHVSTEVLQLGSCQVQLQFYPKGKPSTKHEGKPCFYLLSHQIQSGSKFQIKYECSIKQDDVRYTTGIKVGIFTSKTLKEHVIPSQQIARFGTLPTFCLDITSISHVSDISMKLSRDMNIIRPGTFTDGEGGEWKVKFVGGERSGLTLALAPCMSLQGQTDMSVLHWKCAFLPRRSKQEPLPLNDGKVMCATTACQDSHVTEFRMETSLNTTQFITNQYLQNKRLLLRIEIVKIQSGVLMPQPHDMMVNVGLRSAAKLVDRVQELEDENASLLSELQELKEKVNQNKTEGINESTQVNEEDFRRPSSTSSQPLNPNAGVSEGQLDHLAGNLGHNWKRLAIKLNFKLNEIEQIEEETSLVRERIFSMLYKWKRRTRRSSTVGKLVEALKSVDEDYEAYRFLLDQ